MFAASSYLAIKGKKKSAATAPSGTAAAGAGLRRLAVPHRRVRPAASGGSAGAAAFLCRRLGELDRGGVDREQRFILMSNVWLVP